MYDIGSMLESLGPAGAAIVILWWRLNKLEDKVDAFIRGEVPPPRKVSTRREILKFRAP